LNASSAVKRQLLHFLKNTSLESIIYSQNFALVSTLVSITPKRTRDGLRPISQIDIPKSIRTITSLEAPLPLEEVLRERVGKRTGSSSVGYAPA
jgi:hypothetical protein